MNTLPVDPNTIELFFLLVSCHCLSQASFHFLFCLGCMINYVEQRLGMVPHFTHCSVLHFSLELYQGGRSSTKQSSMRKNEMLASYLLLDTQLLLSVPQSMPYAPWKYVVLCFLFLFLFFSFQSAGGYQYYLLSFHCC